MFQVPSTKLHFSAKALCCSGQRAESEPALSLSPQSSIVFWIWRCVGSIHPAPTLRNCPEKRIPDKKDSKSKCKAVYRSATTADRIKQFPVTSTQTELSKALTGSLGQSCRMIWIRSTMRSTKLWAGSPKSEPFRTPMM